MIKGNFNIFEEILLRPDGSLSDTCDMNNALNCMLYACWASESQGRIGGLRQDTKLVINDNLDIFEEILLLRSDGSLSDT